MKSLFCISILLFSLNVFSQRGKDGTVNITTANSVVNNYTPLTSNATAGSTSINVGNSAGYAIGDLVMIIQMQGAGVRASFDNLSGDYTNSIPENTTHGEIYTYNNSGNYEFAEITDVPGATSIVLDCGLKKNYDVTLVTTANPFPHGITLPGKVQVVRVPRYYALTVSGAGSLVCPAWNGSTGGILVVEVETNALLNTTPSIDVSGRGFRGGAIETNLASNFGGQKWGSSVAAQGAYKGESIAGDTSVYRLFSSVFARGAIANGGGGGTSHNSGGGGGANGGAVASYNGYGNPVTGYTTIWNLESAGFSANTSSGGGKGGYTWSNSNQVITTRAPGATQWGGDSRRTVGGMGGRPLDYSTGRLFIGGGGGAGDGNDGKAGAGGNGGGMFYMICYGNLTGSGTILANGANGSNSTPGCTANDAGGGGGGGGTIVLNVNGTTNLTAPTALSAKGGSGGNVVFNCVLTNSDAYGPGGGAGGGYIATSGAIPTNNVAGGANGIQTGNSSNISASFPPNGATIGGAGSSGAVTNYTLTISASQTVCANQSFTVSASSTEPGTSVSWFNNLVGGTAIASGSTYVAPGFPAAGTYTLFAGVCPGTYRQPVVITVNSGLAISVNSPTICPGQSVVLTPTSTATSYTWSTSQTTNTISVNPAVTTVYTVTGTNGSCLGSKTATVTIGSGIGVTVNSPTICAGTNTVLSAGGATTYSWSTGALTSTISVNPSSTTIYTVIGTAGSCTGTATSTVSVNALPVLTVTAAPPAICAGGSSTLTVSGANTYTWSNSFNGNTQAVNPTGTTNYSVTGTSAAGCSNTLNASVTVTITPNPTVTVNSPTICAGQSATLSATGAATYSWSTSQTSPSISVSPGTTTVYTVTGTSATCNSVQMATVTVSPAMIIAVNSPTICSGQSALLTATSAATSYTWNTGANTNTISVAPTSTTIYTVAGSAGTCAGGNTATVTVNASPVINATASPANICTGQATTLTVTGATTYTWSNGPNTSSQTVSPASDITYSVSGTSSGCTNAVPFTITVNVTPMPAITVNSATICPVSFATLTPSGATSYTWSTGAFTPFIHPGPTATTEYTVTGSNGGCTASAVATVVVLPAPSITIAASITSGCAPLCVHLTETTGSSSYSVQYDFGDGSSGTVKNPTHCYTTGGLFTPSVTITDPSFGCTNVYVLTNTITVSDQPTALFSITGGSVVIAGNTLNLINNSSNASTYLWTLCNSNTYTSKDLSISSLDTGNCCIRLIALSGNGCTDTMTQCIDVINEASVSVPNVFTPNSDSKNDLFRISSIGIKNLDCSIYDRWGIKMYEWDGINGYWDGKTKTGAAAVDGSYFYIINYTDFKDVSKTEKGFLSLFRN
jgi:gliding motility-associated-like protein